MHAFSRVPTLELIIYITGAKVIARTMRASLACDAHDAHDAHNAHDAHDAQSFAPGIPHTHGTCKHTILDTLRDDSLKI